MSFRALISYNLLKYLNTGDNEYMVMFTSLCNSFNVDKVKILTKFYTVKNTKLINRALKCDTYLKELELSYPQNILKELLIIKLNKFNKTIKRNNKLPTEGYGIVIIHGNEISYDVDENTLSYIKLKYMPSVYKYVEKANTAGTPKDCTVLIFGYETLEYITFMRSKRILSNNDIKVKVTDECIERLLDKTNADLVDCIFGNKSNNIISTTLNEIYLSVKSTLYGEESISSNN
ncbi:ORF-42 [Teiidae poxvirus 1]|nr:ORF-42 [Teiidae poxvirus 1]